MAGVQREDRTPVLDQVKHDDGKIAISMNSDGTGFAYYPSGNIALCIIHTKTQNVTIATLYCYDDVPKSPKMLAAIDSRGHGFSIRGKAVSYGNKKEVQAGVLPGYKLLSDAENGVRLADGSGILIPSQMKELIGADVTLPKRLQKKLNQLSADENNTGDGNDAKAAMSSSDEVHKRAQSLSFQGRRYFYGTGVAKSQRKGAEFYRKAAALGHAPSAFRLGMCYQEGSGVPRDLERALDFYEQAAQSGHVPAMSKLGVMLGNGIGCVADVDRAISILETATRQGSTEAKYELRRIKGKARMMMTMHKKERKNAAESSIKATTKRPAAAAKINGGGDRSGKAWNSGAQESTSKRNWVLPMEFNVGENIWMRFYDTRNIDFLFTVNGIEHAFHIARPHEKGGIGYTMGNSDRRGGIKRNDAKGGSRSPSSPSTSTLFTKFGTDYQMVQKGEFEPHLELLREAHLIAKAKYCRGKTIKDLSQTLKSACTSVPKPPVRARSITGKIDDIDTGGVKACKPLARSMLIRGSSGKYCRDIPTKKGVEIKKFGFLSDSVFRTTLESDKNLNKVVAILCVADWQPACTQVLQSTELEYAKRLKKAKKDGIDFPFKVYRYDMSSSRMMTALYNLNTAPAVLMYYNGNLVYASKLAGRSIKIKDARPFNKKVLLVEPNFLMQTRYEQVLRKLNLSWNLAMDGKGVVNLANSITSEQNSYGICVIDLDLAPQELNSIAGSTRLGASNKNVDKIKKKKKKEKRKKKGIHRRL
mmetsp:Transcript_35613/g.57213  ORF Transcript_35613/g.57213 Transcript_35613/m.57213 type:complete len:759 (-) Transcript_35613:460-2736(-)